MAVEKSAASALEGFDASHISTVTLNDVVVDGKVPVSRSSDGNGGLGKASLPLGHLTAWWSTGRMRVVERLRSALGVALPSPHRFVVALSGRSCC
jgi:hypothetical protein